MSVCNADLKPATKKQHISWTVQSGARHCVSGTVDRVLRQNGAVRHHRHRRFGHPCSRWRATQPHHRHWRQCSTRDQVHDPDAHRCCRCSSTQCRWTPYCTGTDRRRLPSRSLFPRRQPPPPPQPSAVWKRPSPLSHPRRRWVDVPSPLPLLQTTPIADSTPKVVSPLRLRMWWWIECMRRLYAMNCDALHHATNDEGDFHATMMTSPKWKEAATSDQQVWWTAGVCRCTARETLAVEHLFITHHVTSPIFRQWKL